MKKTITIPESLHDVTLGQLQKIRTFDGDEEFLAVKMIETLTGIRGDEALRMSVNDRDEIIADLTAALSSDTSKLTKRFKLDGIEFGFVPNLEAMTFGEFIDLKNYEDDFAKMHLLMAVLYRPVISIQGDNYNVEPYVGTAKHGERMKRIPADVALGAMVFFCDLAKELLNSSLNYLKEAATLRTPKSDLVKNGAGTQALIHLQAMTSQDLNKYHSFTLNNALPSWRLTLTRLN